MPTASAVLGDLIDAAGNLQRKSFASVGHLDRATICPIDEMRGQYYLNTEVCDRPGVLHEVSGVFARHGVSIQSMEQEGLGDKARLIFITHEASEASMQATLGDLRNLDAVRDVTSMMRVIGAS